MFASHFLCFSFSLGVYKHIEADPVILARGGFITVCGLGGVVLGSKGNCFNHFFFSLLGGILRLIACGIFGASIGTMMVYPNCSLKSMNFAWDASTRKLLETSEIIKRKFKGAFSCSCYP